MVLRERVVATSEKYEEIVKQWLKQKPAYELQIRQYEEKILALKHQIEDMIMGKITDKSHADYYNSMTEKGEDERRLRQQHDNHDRGAVRAGYVNQMQKYPQAALQAV